MRIRVHTSWSVVGYFCGRRLGGSPAIHHALSLAGCQIRCCSCLPQRIMQCALTCISGGSRLGLPWTNSESVFCICSAKVVAALTGGRDGNTPIHDDIVRCCCCIRRTGWYVESTLSYHTRRVCVKCMFVSEHATRPKTSNTTQVCCLGNQSLTAG